MEKINGISQDAKQVFTVILPDNKVFAMTLEYNPLQTGWFMGVSYGDFTVNALRVCRVNNILSQFQNILPFGIACFTTSGQEPLFQEDFEANNAGLFVLDQDDLDAIEVFLGAKI